MVPTVVQEGDGTSRLDRDLITGPFSRYCLRCSGPLHLLYIYPNNPNIYFNPSKLLGELLFKNIRYN